MYLSQTTASAASTICSCWKALSLLSSKTGSMTSFSVPSSSSLGCRRSHLENTPDSVMCHGLRLSVAAMRFHRAWYCKIDKPEQSRMVSTNSNFFSSALDFFRISLTSGAMRAMFCI